jgi:hypothetical protein
LTLDKPCFDFDISPDGQTIACAYRPEFESMNYVYAIDWQTGMTSTLYTSPSLACRGVCQRLIWALDWVPAGDRLLITYNITPGGQFEITNTVGETLYLSPEVHEYSQSDIITHFVPSPVGDRVVFIVATSVTTFDIATEQMEALYTAGDGVVIYSYDWSPSFDEPLPLPDEPYSLEYLCGLLEESGGHCAAALLSD